MVRRFEWQAKNPCPIRYEIYNPQTEALLVPDDITELMLFVYNTETNEETTAGGAVLSVPDCVFSSPKPWETNNTGFNARIPISGAYLPDGDTTYRIEVLVTPTDGEPYYLDHVEIITSKTYS